MPRPTFPGAPTVGADAPVSILLARVVDVDQKRYTATVVTEGSGRPYPDLPIMTMYSHPYREEGEWVLPDVGALCWIATEGSGASPFIMGFARVPKPITSSENLEEGQEPQEGDEVMPTYGSKSPRRIPGEFGWTHRDGSFFWFRKGGLIEMGSKASCQRIYIPIGNYIRDICENYGQLTAAGYQYFDGGRTEGSDGSDANARWRLMVKAHAADENASVMVDAGIVDDGAASKRFRIVVAPTAIDMSDGSASSTVYTLEIDESGNLNEKASSVHYECSQYALNVSGDKSETVTGSSSEEVTGPKKITSATSIEISAPRVSIGYGTTNVMGMLIAAGLTLTSGVIMLPGGIPFDFAAFMARFLSHVHPSVGPIPGMTGPPVG